jgi:hypothetical protein
MNCPHCNGVIGITTSLIEKEVLYASIKYEGDFLEAKTVGKFITSMEVLLHAVAKETHGKCHIVISSVEQKDHELIIGFLITAVKPIVGKT